ncbi:PREDICTED: uncharacterized protein LOC104746348 [Camelina sativa]|uniref:Uncharacterized protein LOC104746348 n=1 Tax=Camelina sativa TaxID=90675 RepID=A0ABM0W5U5_CAMSA|nr:PREDICTED: uncharacterized protein LOC104746348 [Camelina sativa]
MQSILRSLMAQGHFYRGGRSAVVSRQSRNFCSSPDSITDGIESAIRKWRIVRPVVGLAWGVVVGYLTFGGRASEIRELRLKALKEANEFYKRSEKRWSELKEAGEFYERWDKALSELLGSARKH